MADRINPKAPLPSQVNRGRRRRVLKAMQGCIAEVLQEQAVLESGLRLKRQTPEPDRPVVGFAPLRRPDVARSEAAAAKLFEDLGLE